MATEAHCLYCFETLAARLEKRRALSLQEVESLWLQYINEDQERTTPSDHNQKMSLEQNMLEDDEIAADAVAHQHNLRPRQISRLQNASPASFSDASTPSNSSSHNLSSHTSSNSSLSLLSATTQKEAEYPLFVTWNAVNHRQHRSLRGCIGTFEDQSLSRGLKEYALTSAFHDVRFSPISLSELPTLSCDVTLLTNFTPCKDALDWQIGTHGIRLSFTHHNRKYGSTYLPQVAPEQGWTKEETIISLMRKAGWSGRSSEWRKVNDLKCIRYEGKKADLDFSMFRSWRDWVESETCER